MEFYRKCGWTEDNFLVAFRKNPNVYSVDRVEHFKENGFYFEPNGFVFG